MDFSNYTDKAKKVVMESQALALRLGHQRFTPEHVFQTLLKDDAMMVQLIDASGGNSKVLKQAVDAELKKMPKVEGAGAGQLFLAPETARVIEAADQLAKQSGDQFVTTERMLQALSIEPSKAKQLLEENGVTATELNQAIATMRKGRVADSANAEEQFDALKKYTKDLTEMAQDGKLDPVIGRDEEIRRAMQVLSRRTKNNPVLIGEPGVGKTAIVEGLAQRIVAGDVPENLKDKKLLSLDLGAMVADRKSVV